MRSLSNRIANLFKTQKPDSNVSMPRRLKLRQPQRRQLNLHLRRTLNTTTDGGWQLRRNKDAMTDKTSCILSPVGKPHVQISVGDLYISYRGRGGVSAFSYRMDDGPASQLQLPTEIDKQIGFVHISGDAFNSILRASRLRVQVLTVLSNLLNEDLALSGMRSYMQEQQECPKGKGGERSHAVGAYAPFFTAPKGGGGLTILVHSN